MNYLKVENGKKLKIRRWQIHTDSQSLFDEKSSMDIGMNKHEYLNTLSAKLNSRTFKNLSIIFLLLFQMFLIVALTTNNIDFLTGNFTKIIITSLTIIGFLILLLLAVSMNSRTSAIKDLLSSAEKLSYGELNISDIVVTENDDYKTLAKAFNTMKSNLLFFIENTKKNVIVLSDAIEKVTAGMDMTCQGNDQVTNAIQNIAENSANQLIMVNNTVAKIEEVYSSINSIAYDIHDVEEEATVTTTFSKQGHNNLNIYEQSISMISDSMKDTKEFISNLKQSISEISNVNSFILGISGQLKLLSLNASIEAARSGETGKGFSVVANEITILSESTRQEIDKINAIILKLLENGSQLENSIKKSIEDFEKGSNVYSEVKEVFNSIMSRNIKILGNISQVTNEAKKINNIVKDTSALSQEVYNSSSSISRSTTEVAAATEEMNAEFTQINQIVASLQNFVQDINKLTDIFKIGIRPVEVSASKQLRIGVILPKTGVELWNIVGEGALYAAKELSTKNTNVEIIEVCSAGGALFSDYFEAINNCVGKKYDGLCIVGFDSKYTSVINSLASTGTTIMMLNTDISTGCERLGCVMPNDYQSGIIGAESMMRYLNGKGKVLIIDNEMNNNVMALRNSGFETRIKKSGHIELLQKISLPGNETPDAIKKLLKDYLKLNKDIDGIFFSSRFRLQIVEVFEELNLGGKVKLIVYDIDKDICNYVKKGIVTCVLGQDSFGQGHDSVTCLYNYLVTKQKPENEIIWTKCDIVDTENIQFLLN